jgi:hypothetical protein
MISIIVAILVGLYIRQLQAKFGVHFPPPYATWRNRIDCFGVPHTLEKAPGRLT